MQEFYYSFLPEGRMIGCMEGCPVGRAHRGYIFKHALRQLVELAKENVLDNEGNVPALT